ncbi:MAG: efflux RND transporter periplasmic adaptor subunit [Prevotella sp.]|uniref:efflux RND transporter periplasmic adaptor subunit n=1 Tax=Prevotella sp. TaxID=59823 RepID=UPI002A32D788|nr:efflux RND transporter periplasmic adaptor subunit [Prevotella sp.]MDD7317938.1 efflux RND transporter periplasmic adaptor subunit [Prevotellaceae bacterium]MDY4020829.1 efflux RND transporter periplasmic adaptor subunit [Prevotella sp.]
MKKGKILLFAAVFAMLASCGNQGGKGFGDNEFPVETVKSQSTSMQTSYPVSLKGIQDVEIRPKVAGFITKVCVKEGQAVNAGQLLFVIDNATYQASVRQAQAAVNTATAQCNTMKLACENSIKLYENKVIGDFELQSAKNNYESAKAQLAQAKAALASANEMLSFCYVKSPTAGVVGTLPYKEGAMVSASSTPALTTVSNISSVEAYFSVTEKDLLEMTKTSGSMQAAIEQYPDLKLQLSDGTTYSETGRLVKASGVVDAATGSVQMIARFPNPQRLLKSGSSGVIVVPRSNNNAIIIPQSVTVEVQDKVFVYLLGSDNKVKYTEIKVDAQNDGKNYVVLSGMKVGDRYVTNGMTKLSDGMEIKPITTAQYQKKIDEARELGEKQGTAKGFVDAMSK